MGSERQELEAGIVALDSQRRLLGDAVVDAAIGPMRARLETLLDGARGGDAVLKHVSILFLDVVGSTALSQVLDPEETSVVMDGALSRATTIVAAHRGRVLQYAGDSLLAVFGGDGAQEDDAERAVHCGLALLALGRTLAGEVDAAHGHAGFDVRVGVHSGGVLLGGGIDEGGSIRGMPVNVAARMEQTAPPGALRISHETYAQVRGVFDVIPQEPLAVKGVDTPIASYLVRRAKPRTFRVASRGIEGLEIRMVGRDAELARLQAGFRRLVRPGNGLERLIVVADAGLGKSRLLYEFRNWAEAQAESFFVFQARATPQTQGQPYGLLRDLLAWRLQIGDGDRMDVARQKFEDGLMPLFADDGVDEAEAQVHLLGQLIGLDYDSSRQIRGIRDDGRQIRNRGFHAAAMLLRRIGAASRSPVVVYLDDLHWADDPSLDFIDYVAQVDREVPILIVGCARPALFERRPASPWATSGDARDRIDLRAFDRSLGRSLADELLKKVPQVPAALCDLVTDGAGGNPFYMEELVRMLIDRHVLSAGDERWSLDAARLLSLQVPPTLTGVLQARLDALPRSEKHALQLASVIGLNFWDAALAYLEPKSVESLGPLARRDLVVPKDTSDVADDVREYSFHHQLLHRVAYDTVLKSVRRDAHGKAARWLADHSGVRAKGLLGNAAEHFERAGEHGHAAHFYARAAEYTASTFANEAVLDYAARGLALVPTDQHALRWRLLATRERTLDLLGRRTEQLGDIESLLALAESLDDDAKRAEAAWRRCDIAHRTGDWATQEREARRAQVLADRGGDGELALRAIERLATAIAYSRDPAAGRAQAEAGLTRARAIGLLGAEARLVNAITCCAEVQGDRIGALRYSALSLSLSRELGDRRIEAMDLANLGISYEALGDHDRARRHLEEALQMNRALGNREIEGGILGSLSGLAAQQGEYMLALEHARVGVAIQTEVDSRLHLADALWFLGNAQLALGHMGEAEAVFDRKVALAREIGQPSMVMNALEGHARVALARGDDDSATRMAIRLLVEAGLDPVTSAGEPVDAVAEPWSGTNEHRIRLTLYQVWSRTGDARADAALLEAHRALRAAADTISDDTLRRSFLYNIAEHREIEAAWATRASGVTANSPSSSGESAVAGAPASASSCAAPCAPSTSSGQDPSP